MGSYQKEDLRVIKTHRALKKALMTLLETKNFRRITVNDICAEALTSRAAFYTHFCDKYVLLKCTFEDLLKDKFSYEDIDEIINRFIYEKNKMIRNLFDDADNETMEVLQAFVLKIIERAVSFNKDKTNPEYVILSNFCVGGIIQVLNWQIKHYYPEELNHTKKYFHNIVKATVRSDFRHEKDICEVNKS